MKLNQTLAIDAGDQEEWKRQLRPSYGVLWAEIDPTTRKSILAKKGKVRPRLSNRGGTRTKVKTPTKLNGYARLGEGRPNDHQSKLRPTSRHLQETNRYTKLKSAETLIWTQEESNVSNQQESDQVFVRWGGDFLL